jgi:BirA family biotin operon repressor/biotin-[acetyl-CoA-carboxylase] ligase
MERMALLPLAVGLAAAEAVENVSGLKVDLRWPNDLLMGRRKAGGILVEASTQAGGTAFAVVGIGINVHQKAFDPALDTPATSLDIETGRSVSRQKLLVALLKSLERVHVHGPEACTGVTSGLDENGFLQVDTHAGRVIVRTGGIRAAEME